MGNNVHRGFAVLARCCTPRGRGGSTVECHSPLHGESPPYPCHWPVRAIRQMSMETKGFEGYQEPWVIWKTSWFDGTASPLCRGRPKPGAATAVATGRSAGKEQEIAQLDRSEGGEEENNHWPCGNGVDLDLLERTRFTKGARSTGSPPPSALGCEGCHALALTHPLCGWAHQFPALTEPQRIFFPTAFLLPLGNHLRACAPRPLPPPRRAAPRPPSSASADLGPS